MQYYGVVLSDDKRTDANGFPLLGLLDELNLKGKIHPRSSMMRAIFITIANVNNMDKVVQTINS
ncbi:hypothetical protein EI427_20910 [Flammeovirga pectinis]|uniref:Uncharacterized protein n=1 Tax=Flammeovirga pectinis TaxID=2494373 RepID=A0A3S9P927_9BACT|nr:hypothetical protein [Flammeovirga pectinis]AZQ64687.1 hypothetical protein EI427_20910 [Flammeovirga pectinis]